MFFLIRAAFWLSIVILLLPADPESGAEAPRVTVFQALGAAREAIGDLSGLCDRNPGVCETGSAVLTLMGQKARYGLRLAQDYVERAFPAGQPVAETRPVEVARPPAAEAGTLTPEDVTIPWQKPARTGAV